MTELSPQALLTRVDRFVQSDSSQILVAFSGGIDSTVLLYALAGALEANRERLCAVHVNHGLHANADAWEAQCKQVALRLNIAYVSRRVSVPDDGAHGIEASARTLRYDALRDLVPPDGVLLTAHHADDQIETMLLALVRGSGVDGLAAMPSIQRFGRGWHVRPLLEFTREDLLRFATERGLTWLEDPSNDNARFDRNYLRAHVVPALRTRWPGIASAGVRAAGHLSEAKQLLDELATHDFATASVGPCLKVSTLAALTSPRRRNVLRYWVRSCGARPPSTRKLASLEHDMLEADPDRNPLVGWDGFEVRRHRGLLYCQPEVADGFAADVKWHWSEPLSSAGAGKLRAEIVDGAGIAMDKVPLELSVRTRIGGESIRLPGADHRRTLKNLLHEAHVLPWWRERLPLVFVGGTLAAVADLWVAAEFATAANEPGLVLHWEDRPRIHAIDS